MINLHARKHKLYYIYIINNTTIKSQEVRRTDGIGPVRGKIFEGCSGRERRIPRQTRELDSWAGFHRW